MVQPRLALLSAVLQGLCLLALSYVGAVEAERPAEMSNGDHRILQSCEDLNKATFFDDAKKKRNCAWLAQSLDDNFEEANLRYCNPPAGRRLPLAAAICPETCRRPCPRSCKDTSALVGHSDGTKKKKKCSWIKKSAKRKARYCSSGLYSVSRADAACPRTCGKCDTPEAPTDTPTRKAAAAPSKRPTALSVFDRCAATADPAQQSCNVRADVTCMSPDGTDCDNLKSNTSCSQTPRQIRFRFTGRQCYETNNEQDKAMKCMSAFSGTMGLKEARITVLGAGANAGDSSHLYFTKNMQIGDEFTVFGTKVFPDTPAGELRKLTVVIQDDENLIRQSMLIQMDCNQHDLQYGDRFGALEVLSYENDYQGQIPTNAKVEYIYEVSNEAKMVATVKDITTTLHGSLVPGLGRKTPMNVDVCNSAKLVQPDRVNLLASQTHSTTMTVQAENAAGLTCDSSFFYHFTSGGS